MSENHAMPEDIIMSSIFCSNGRAPEGKSIWMKFGRPMQIEILAGFDIFFSSSGDIFKSPLYTYQKYLNHLLQGNTKSRCILRITQSPNIRLAPYIVLLMTCAFHWYQHLQSVYIADLLLMTCKHQCHKHYQMTQQKVKLLYSSFALESMVDIQLHSKCPKQLGWP